MANAILDGKEHWDDVRSRIAPVCGSCQNWKVGTENCLAFPDGIPDEIFMYGNPHTTKVSGDHGIQFEKKEIKQ